ncbi:MAG: hypothetical protein PWQ82_1158 [Thermosediminibacterales bacterium]|nr:hypothetical protein [Thermosediminibacterales bacterium]
MKRTARCEACGRRLRRDEGKLCRFCIGKLRKLIERHETERRGAA